MSTNIDETEYVPTRGGKNEYFSTEAFYVKAEEVFEIVWNSPGHKARFGEIREVCAGVDNNILNVTLKRLREAGALVVESPVKTGRKEGRYAYVAVSRSKANLRPVSFNFSELMGTAFIQSLTPAPDKLEVRGSMQNFLDKEGIFENTLETANTVEEEA